jgi:hypothetical protein
MFADSLDEEEAAEVEVAVPSRAELEVLPSEGGDTSSGFSVV